MVILKEGKCNPLQFECLVCGCIFIANRTEYEDKTFVNPFDEDDYHYETITHCPCCEKPVYFKKTS